jgi:hypothetical protein
MEAPNKPESIKYPEIAAEITAMYDADQDMRIKAEEDDSIWDETMDPRNTARMKEIVEDIGWPTISKVGEKVSGDAWLLVQHADRNVDFQKHCLELMKAEQAGEVALHDIAYLEDRVRVNSGQPQLYGTQFRWEGSKPIQNIEDPEHIEERRKEMGLNTLAENLEDMYETYKMPKPDKFPN